MKVHESVTNASRELNITSTRIITACKNGVNTTGFIWKYAQNAIIEGEEWKQVNIKGFENYKISNRGRLLNKKNIIMKPRLNEGYLYVTLHRGSKQKTISIHQLVGIMFIPNPDNLPIVNHKNGKRSDNVIDNLEWINNSGNIKHAFENKLFVPHMRKIVQLTLENQLIKIYQSLCEAKKDGFLDSSICAVCKGKNKLHKGYKWMYYEDYINLNS